MRHWRAPAGASLQPANPTTSGAWLALTLNPSISRVERPSRGLTDTHVHLSEKGTAEMELIDCRDFYTDVHSIADILERLAKRAAEAPKGSWLVAHGSPMQDFRLNDKRFPDKHDLDGAIPDHLVSISFGAHITVGNSQSVGGREDYARYS